jgi:hypothetical protein
VQVSLRISRKARRPEPRGEIWAPSGVQELGLQRIGAERRRDVQRRSVECLNFPLAHVLNEDLCPVVGLDGG